MQCVKITGKMNNYEVEINRIIKEMRQKNMYLEDAYVEDNAIHLKFLRNEDENFKIRNVAVQGKIKNYETSQNFRMTQVNQRKMIGGPIFTTWSIISYFEIGDKYLMFLRRKRKGYHRKKRR